MQQSWVSLLKKISNDRWVDMIKEKLKVLDKFIYIWAIGLALCSPACHISIQSMARACSGGFLGL